MSQACAGTEGEPETCFAGRRRRGPARDRSVAARAYRERETVLGRGRGQDEKREREGRNEPAPRAASYRCLHDSEILYRFVDYRDGEAQGLGSDLLSLPTLSLYEARKVASNRQSPSRTSTAGLALTSQFRHE